MQFLSRTSIIGKFYLKDCGMFNITLNWRTFDVSLKIIASFDHFTVDLIFEFPISHRPDDLYPSTPISSPPKLNDSNWVIVSLKKYHDDEPITATLFQHCYVQATTHYHNCLQNYSAYCHNLTIVFRFYWATTRPITTCSKTKWKPEPFPYYALSKRLFPIILIGPISQRAET